jgi:hypothetical protein
MRLTVAGKAFIVHIINCRMLGMIKIDVCMNRDIGERLRVFSQMAIRTVGGIRLVLMAVHTIRHLRQHTKFLDTIGFDRIMTHRAIQPNIFGVLFMAKHMCLWFAWFKQGDSRART